MWVKVKDLQKGQRIVVKDNGETRTVGTVRIRDGKAIVFCVDYISPVFNVDDMLMTL